MSRKYLLIEGGYPLEGSVEIQGAKNSALPLFASMIVCEGKTKFKNIPFVKDTLTMLSLLSHLGLEISIDRKKNEVEIRNKGLKNFSAPLSFIRKMRASIYVLGPVLTQFGKAKVGIPGGCAFGPRPINFHIKGLKKLGVSLDVEEGYIFAKVNDFKDARIKLPKISVGTTIHLAITASKIEREVVIENIAVEPEVIITLEFLKKAGADIKLDGRKVIIHGNKNLKAPSEFTNIPDRIEAGTYMMFLAATGGRLRIYPDPSLYLGKVMDVLKKIGVDVNPNGKFMEVIRKDDIIYPVNISTAPYPGFPTDLQPQLTTLMTQAKGKSVIKERVYPERFGYVGELIKMGANIEISHGIAKVEGKTDLKSAPLETPDIRAGAALILAALVSHGKSKIYNIEHIERGYENIHSKLKKLGANIRYYR